MRRSLAQFSSTRKKLVNENLIKCRNTNNMVSYINNFLKEAVKLLNGDADCHVDYLGYESDDSYLQPREINKVKTKSKRKSKDIIVSTSETLSRAYRFKFKLRLGNEERLKEIKLYIPVVADDGINNPTDFVIRGNVYCAPLQLIDSVIYTVKNNKGKYDEVVLRATVKEVRMRRYKTTIVDIFGNKFDSYTYTIFLNNRVDKIPFILYYFSTFGFFKTLEYFGLSNDIVRCRVYETVPSEDDPINETDIFFRFGKVFLGISRSAFKDPHIRSLFATILSTGKRNMDMDRLRSSVTYWLPELGKHLSVNGPVQTGITLRKDFREIIDISTINNLKTYTEVGVGVDGIHDTYTAIRWMFYKFPLLVRQDNASLYNKRIRVTEYLIHPFKEDLISRIFQFKNVRGSFRVINKLEDVFKVSSSIIIDHIAGKGRNYNTGKFSNSVNAFALLNVITKATQSGPNTPGGKSSKYMPRSFKYTHPSFVGNLDLISTSTNKPGITLNVLPNAPIDDETLGFKPKDEQDE